jgi:CubicO group peptidase (beta-lactamase class C family)
VRVALFLRQASIALIGSLLIATVLLAQAPLRRLTQSSVVLTIDRGPDEPRLPVTLAQMMNIYREPGLSIAVIEHGQIAWSNGFGVTGAGEHTPVTPHTLFQAASISKPVTAAGALWLVQQGKLSLDGDVNRELTDWRVPDDSFTAQQKVTLRRLLSHNAGVNVHGFDGYARGQPLPNTEQTLDGRPPANNPPVRVTTKPGTACNYSGGGFTIAGLMMKDVSGQSFEDFMREHVLLPAGMTASTFQQDLPPALAARAATGTDRDGKSLPGKWRLYPELAPDGLWTTPSDLAKFALEIARSARDSANHILSQSTVREMLTVQCRDDPSGGTGLGFGLGYQNHAGIFLHNGSNAGFQAILMMAPDAGWGYAAMGNSDNFEEVDRAVLRTLSIWYGWGVESYSRDLGENLVIVRALRSTAAAMAYYRWAKSTGFIGLRHDVNTLNYFGYDLLGSKQLADAIRVLKWNVAAYPQDANVYDSLGEAYMDAGERSLAIKNYEKSLELNPKNDNAIARLRQLRSHR